MRHTSLTILLWKLLTLASFAQIETRPVPNMIDSSLNGILIQDSLQANPAADSLVENGSATTKYEFSIMDSLDKYSAVDSFYKRYPNGHMLSIVKANKTSFAAYFLFSGGDEDWEEEYPPFESLVFFNRKQGGQWLQTDIVDWNCSTYGNYGKEDLNGDGFTDLVFHFYAVKHGENLVFIFNKKTRQFEHDSQFDLENISFDTKSKFVRSHTIGGMFTCSSKMRYRVVGKILKFDLGAKMCPDERIHRKTASLRYYTMKNGEEITIKLIKGSFEKIYTLYTKAIWDSSLD